MEAVARNLSPEDEVHGLLDGYVDAVRALDVERIVAHYAPDIVAYDGIGELEYAGLDAYKAHWKSCLDMCQSMIFEPHEPTIAVSGGLAVGHYLVQCGGTGREGKECSGWFRATFAARKQSGRWLIFHEHFSAPFDPVDNKVHADLAPKV